MKKRKRRNKCNYLHDGTSYYDRKNKLKPKNPLCLHKDKTGFEPNCNDCLLNTEKHKFMYCKVEREVMDGIFDLQV